MTWRLRDTKYSRFYFQLQVSVPRTGESVSGLLPTVMASDGTRRGEILQGQKKKRPSGQIYAPNLSDLAKNGLLPAPTVMEDSTRKITKQNYRKKKGNLATAAIMGLLPTPTTGSNRNSRNAVQLTGEAHQHHGVALGLMQVAEISAGILPKEFDHWEQVPQHYQNLLYGTSGMTGRASQLNPRFVMEMMGFPPDWTTLPFLSGAPKA